jgi:nitrogen fixation protein FixH
MAVEFLQGQVARLSVTVTDVTGAAVDASSLTLKIKHPSGNIDTITSAIAQDGTGQYHYDLDLNNAGSYSIRWESTGQTQGASESSLFVFESQF